MEKLRLEEAVKSGAQIAFFAAGGKLSKEWAPKFIANGCKAIDNSSYFRMESEVKLIVPQVNGASLKGDEMLIANPNCATIGMVVALNLLHKRYGLKEVSVASYQSVSGSGYSGSRQLQKEQQSRQLQKTQQNHPTGNSSSPLNPATNSPYPHPIDQNLIAQIDSFTPNGYTKEELKFHYESRKIFKNEELNVTATAVRVPVMVSHALALTATFKEEVNMEEVYSLLKRSPGVISMGTEGDHHYPTPLMVEGRDEVFVGRVRGVLGSKNGVTLWVVSDNRLKGAATNAVEIAELLL